MNNSIFELIKSSRKTVVLLTTAVLVFSGFFIAVPALAAHTASVTILPTSVIGDSSSLYTLTVENEVTSTNGIIIVVLNVPINEGNAEYVIDAGSVNGGDWGANFQKDASENITKITWSLPLGGTPLGAGDSKNFTFTATAPSSEGSYTWSVVTTDTINETDPSDADTMVDNTPSIVMGVTSDEAIYNKQTESPVLIKVTFNEDISNAPTIAVGGEQTVSDCDDGDATTFCFDYAIPASTEDTKTIIISGAQDLAGNLMEEDSTHIFKVDTQEPLAPVVNLTDPINLSNQGAVSITGGGEPNATVNYSIDDEDEGTLPVEGSDAVDGDENINISDIDVSSLSDGTLTLTVTLTDAAENESNPATDEVTKDTEAPAIASIISDVTEVGWLKVGDIITFTLTPSDLEPDAEVSGSYNGQTLDWTTSNSGVTYITTYTVIEGELDQLIALQITSVVITDTASNPSVFGAGIDIAKTIDANTPAASVNLVLTDPVNIANEGAVSITGGGEPNATVNYSIDDEDEGTLPVEGSDAVDGDENINISDIDVSSLSDGTLTLTVTLVDEAGNTSTPNTDTAIKDTEAPTAPAVNFTDPINIANETVVLVTGGGEANAIINYSISDGVSSLTGSGIVSAEGTINITGINVTSLDDGILTLIVILTDAAGNAGDEGTNTATKDTGAPVITSIISDATGGGWLKVGDTITFILTSGSAEPDAIIVGSYNGVVLAWTANVDSTAFIATYAVAEGNADQSSSLQIFQVIITDAVGNSSTAGGGSDVAKTIDANTPIAPIITSIAADNKINDAEKASIIVIGTAEEDALMMVNLTSGVIVTGTEQLTNAATIYTITIDGTTLSDGTVIPSVVATDVAGNVSPATILPIATKDTVTPVVNITFPLTGDNVNNEAAITFDDNELTDPQCSINETDWITCESGTTKLADITGFSNLPEGAFLLYLRDTDNVGNTGTDSETGIIKDITPPTITGFTFPTADAVYVADVPLTFVASDNNLDTCSYVIGSGIPVTIDCTGGIIPVANLSDGRNIIVLTATDLAGNSKNSDPISFVFNNDQKLTVNDTPENNPDFTTIQAAVDVATVGDTIQVAAGTYAENYSTELALKIDKSLTINGTDLPIVDASGKGKAIQITADNVIVSGIKVVNATDVNTGGIGIYLFGVGNDYTSNNTTITGCDISNNYIGLFLAEANSAMISGNTFTDNTHRSIIIQQDSDNNTIKGNTIVMSGTATLDGIVVGSDSGNNVIGTESEPNAITMSLSTTEGEGGAHLPRAIYLSGVGESNNTIQYNTIDGSASAIQIDGNTGITTVDHNIIGQTIVPSFRGVQINGGSLVLTNNNLKDTVRPIEFWEAVDVTITGNTIDGTTYDFINIGSFTGTLFPIQNNIFLNVGTHKLNNQTGSTVDATYNYWGTAVKATIESKINGDVIFEPYYVNEVGENGILSDVKPTTVSVDDDYPETVIPPEGYYFGYNAFATIQEGINAVAAYGTINVSAGMYNEQVIIDKALTLSGATSDVSKRGYTIPDNYAWEITKESVIQWNTPNGENVKITSDDVTFEGFIVSNVGRVAPVTEFGAYNLLLVSPTVDSDNIKIINNILGPNTDSDEQDGTKGRHGLYLNSFLYTLGAEVTGNKIFDVKGNGNGIILWGPDHIDDAGGDYTGTVISGNEITGIHRSGIELSGGVKNLTITDNDIHNNGGQWIADKDNQKFGNGIVLVRNGGGNQIYKGLDAVTPGIPEFIKNIIITNNNIYGNEKSGIYTGPKIKNITITGNNIYNNGNMTGYFGAGDDFSGTEGIWDGIRVDLTELFDGRNTEYANYVDIDNILANSNNIEDNAGHGIRVIGTPTDGFILDAKKNWWGSINGPTHSSNAGGSGDTISDNVSFRPWYTNPELANLDIADPTVVISVSDITNDPTNISPIPVVVTFNEAVTNFEIGDIVVTNGTAGSFSGSGITYNFVVTPETEYQGAITVDITANVAWDLSGNYNEVVTQFSIVYDTVSPTATVSYSPAGLTNEDVTATMVANETVTVTSEGGLSHLFTDNGSFTFIFDDVAGNSGSVIATVANIDKIAPTGYSVSIDQNYINNSNKAALSFTFASAEVDATYNYSVDDANVGTAAISGNGSISIATDQITSIDVSGLDDETLTLTVYLTDPAGNQGSDVIDTAVKDIVAPTVSSHVPTVNAMNVEPANDIIITFNEAVIVQTGDVLFSPSFTDFTIKNSETDVVTISLNTALDSNINYTITLSEVTDLAENVMDAYNNINFTTATYYNISLYFTATGWNLVSLPVVPNDTAIETVLGGASSDIKEIWTYNPTHPNADSSGWLMYSTDDPAETNNLDIMTTGYGYWISVTDNTNIEGWGSLLTAGPTTPPSRTLAVGWNLIGYYQIPGEESSTVSKAFASLQNDYKSLWGYNNEGGSYKSTVTTIEPGDGFWISLISGKEYTPSNLTE